jgi:predicted transcriptional regulator
MRKTTKQPVALANIEQAWAEFYETTKVESEADLLRDGWKTARTIAEDTKITIAAINSRLDLAANKGLLETRKATIQTKQGIREVNLFRPRLKK